MRGIMAGRREKINSPDMPKRKRPPARTGRLPGLPLRLSVTAASGAALVPYLRRHIAAAHALLKRSPLAELSIALVGDRRMSELHEQFMGIPGPTDVLTFPLELDRRGRPLSGEVVICVPEARRRGTAEGTGLRREALLYALHGLLHLCGFDDRTRSDYATMHRTEDAILTTLGIGPVFSNGDGPDSKATFHARATHTHPRYSEGAQGRGLERSDETRATTTRTATPRKANRPDPKRRSSPAASARRASRRAV
jgi:probable rRNA maturation factor